MKILLILTVLLLSACSMTEGELALETQKLAVMSAAMDKPTLTCTAGCEYTDPKRNLSLFPKETNGWDFGKEILRTVTTIAPWATVGLVATKGIVNAGSNTYNTDSNNSHSEANQQTSSTATDNNSINDSGNSNDDNSVNDSGNSTDDNSAVDDNSTDSNDTNSTVTESQIEPVEITPII